MKKPGTLTFDPGPHRYTLRIPPLAEIEIPSVSDVIRPVVNLGGAPPSRLEFARDRGHAVHRACELYDLRDLDEDSIDEVIVPYLKAWAQFTSDHSPHWTAVEEPDHHPTLMYAGTPDRKGVIRQKRVTVDMKATYALNPAVQVQLSGYDLLDEEPADELWSVRLKKDGSYEVKIHKAAHSTFLACLNIYRWQQRNKCLPPKF